MTNSLRPNVRRIARLSLGAGVLGVAIAVFATARAAQVEPPKPAAPVEVEHVEPAAPASIPRIGFRHGRPRAIDVVKLNGVEVEISTARAFLAMQAAAAKDGIELRIESGFRTVDEQRELYHAWRQGRGNKAALPGQSNHQSGRALDIVVRKKTYEWLEANAATFRFKRTVKGEPWHWEYVDAPTARDPSIRIAKVKKSKAKVRYVKRAAKRQGARGSARVATLGN